MGNTAEDILILLEKYFVYIYPGFISYFVLYFAKAKKLEKNHTTFISCLVVSYVYIIIYKFFRKIPVEEFNNIDYIVLFLLALVLPLIWNYVSRCKWFENFLRFIGVNTTIEENVWDYIRYRAKDKNEGLSLKVFLDDIGIMYEGDLRYHESDSNKEQSICLSRYRRYKKTEEKYEVTHNYENDASRWVMIKASDIKRVEIKYESKK